MDRYIYTPEILAALAGLPIEDARMLYQEARDHHVSPEELFRLVQIGLSSEQIYTLLASGFNTRIIEPFLLDYSLPPTIGDDLATLYGQRWRLDYWVGDMFRSVLGLVSRPFYWMGDMFHVIRCGRGVPRPYRGGVMSAFRWQWWRFGYAYPEVWPYGIAGWKFLVWRIWWAQQPMYLIGRIRI